MNPATIKRWNLVSLSTGAGVWLLALTTQLGNLTPQVQLKFLLALGVAVVTPLALRVVGEIEWFGLAAKLYRLAVVAQPVVAVLVGVSLVLPRGWAAGGLALAWVGFTGLLALAGLTRFWLGAR